MKHYPLWQQFVDNKSQWIGGELEDSGDTTIIRDITLIPNGNGEHAFFCICGEKFDCGFRTDVGGILGRHSDESWLSFSGYGGHEFRIRKPQAAEVAL